MEMMIQVVTIDDEDSGVVIVYGVKTALEGVVYMG